MLVIVDNAEMKAIRAIETIQEQKQGRRCIHLKADVLSSSESYRQDVLIDMIGNIVNIEEPRVFICEDGDIYVLAYGISPEVYKIFVHYCCKTFDLTEQAMFSTLYEIGHSGHKLIESLRSKIRQSIDKTQQQEAMSAEKRALEQEKRRQKILSLLKDDNMQDVLSSRRKGRIRPEVLVVEDDAFSARMVQNILKEKYNVTLAQDGEAALASYLRVAPDILFLDINLPYVSGHDLLAKFRSIDPDAFIVMLSGNANKPNIVKSMENGAKGFVGKPFTREKLEQYIGMVSI